jgi:predicted amidophosphoribosyltransferase
VARCRECGGRRLAFTSARAAVTYSGAARPLVAAWKEHGLRRAATVAADLVATRLPRPAADVIAYIPPDRARLLVRGHHPAAALAELLGARWGVPVEPLLTRRAYSGGARQTGLARTARAANVRDAFRAVAASPPAVVLVDDVYTTGATASAAAAELRRAGATRVEVVTFARTVRL